MYQRRHSFVERDKNDTRRATSTTRPTDICRFHQLISRGGHARRSVASARRPTDARLIEDIGGRVILICERMPSVSIDSFLSICRHRSIRTYVRANARIDRMYVHTRRPPRRDSRARDDRRYRSVRRSIRSSVSSRYSAVRSLSRAGAIDRLSYEQTNVIQTSNPTLLEGLRTYVSATERTKGIERRAHEENQIDGTTKKQSRRTNRSRAWPHGNLTEPEPSGPDRPTAGRMHATKAHACCMLGINERTHILMSSTHVRCMRRSARPGGPAGDRTAADGTRRTPNFNIRFSIDE